MRGPSQANLQKLEAGQDHFVTAIRPSCQQALLAEAAAHLEEVSLSNGAAVRAWRTRRVIAGQQRDAVVVFSPQLYAGQLRGGYNSAGAERRVSNRRSEEFGGIR
jgi:hypothetical protein